MYPVLPDSPADLVPLPLCDGPKLKPFDFQGPQQIEFLEFLGEGLHSYVFKVKIMGTIYALKLFRFICHNEWISPYFDHHENHEAMTFAYQYSEPFNCECRAFGRLQEAGYDDLAVECFGYLLLDEEHEHAMRQFWKASHPYDIMFNGSSESVDEEDMRSCFQDKNAKPPPIRGIVKEFGQGMKVLQTRGARKIMREMSLLQQLGIFNLDPGIRQMVNNKWADFSLAFTVPHYISNTELNPHLTPEMIADLEFEAFNICRNDYMDFDEMVFFWNKHAKYRKDTISVQALPHRSSFKDSYDLRRLPSRERAYSYVDPRLYDWKASASMGEVDGRQSDRKAKGSKRGTPAGVIRKTRRRLNACPPRWYFSGDSKKAKEAKFDFYFRLHWDFKDGFMFPRKQDGPPYST
ncbi:kinetochore Sim4 complex subunit FTA2-domain-containing protein [Ilyonectria sp. MPI-CAGE-AT-0026]|nr:kinetochore Sim4 complex subunit FTA2-domain-containing protein [Ilyonectria sp. MPI-CAGE-AT-0026]